MGKVLSKKILITAGPTREMFDPVRYLSNLSTGEMGYAVAKAARARGYRVTLISGPTSLKPPSGVEVVHITSAKELESACKKLFPQHGSLIMTAAVCDYTPIKKENQKIRRAAKKVIVLKQTPDIVAGLAKKKGKRVVIGFCLETRDWLPRAVQKCKRKNLDGIVANYLSAQHVPFGPVKTNMAFVTAMGKVRRLPLQSKGKTAADLMKWITEFENTKRVSGN